MALTFCEKCNNIMVLKKNFGNLGEYICRSCGYVKRMPIERIEINEEIRFVEPRPITIFDKREWI